MRWRSKRLLQATRQTKTFAQFDFPDCVHRSIGESECHSQFSSALKSCGPEWHSASQARSHATVDYSLRDYAGFVDTCVLGDTALTISGDMPPGAADGEITYSG